VARKGVPKGGGGKRKKIKNNTDTRRPHRRAELPQLRPGVDEMMISKGITKMRKKKKENETRELVPQGFLHGNRQRGGSPRPRGADFAALSWGIVLLSSFFEIGKRKGRDLIDTHLLVTPTPLPLPSFAELQCRTRLSSRRGGGGRKEQPIAAPAHDHETFHVMRLRILQINETLSLLVGTGKG